jgi:hypothetical protein
MIFVVTEISTGKCVHGLRNLINDLFWSQEDHCRDAHQSELNHKQLPKEYR